MNGSKILAFWEPFWCLCLQKIFDYVKLFVYEKPPWSREKKLVENCFFVEIICEKFSWVWKNSLIVEKFRDSGKFPQLWKNSLTVEKFLSCGKFTQLWKSSLIVENFCNCGKIPSLWKISLIVENFHDWKSSSTVEKFLDCGKVPLLWKSSLIVEKFLDCQKFTFLTAEKNNMLDNFKSKC